MTAGAIIQMVTVTIELPEDVAERLSAVPEGSWRNHYVTQALTIGMDALSPEEAVQERAETIAAIAEALQEVEEGKDRPFEEFVAEWETFWKQQEAS